VTRCATAAIALPQRSRSALATQPQRTSSGVRPRVGSGILAGVVAAERVLELRAEGKSAREIADELGANLRTVQRILADAGQSTPRGRPSTGERERVQIRVDAEVIEELDARAEEEGSSRDRVAATVITAWAQRRRKRSRSAP
jgi:uncharacterized protein (DUF4415 family)